MENFQHYQYSRLPLTLRSVVEQFVQSILLFLIIIILPDSRMILIFCSTHVADEYAILWVIIFIAHIFHFDVFMKSFQREVSMIWANIFPLCAKIELQYKSTERVSYYSAGDGCKIQHGLFSF